MQGLTATTARFIADFGDAPDAACEIATTGIVDAIGVMLAAAHEPVVRAAAAVALEGAAGGGASVLLGPRRARPIDAAFVNAVAAHAFAMDDVAAGCHPSASLMPAILAEGESLASSGADALRAYIVGYEVLVGLAAREPDTLHATGWHPTGLLGPVAVAAAVAALRRLSVVQCSHAIGIAASMSGGLQANFGTQTKALHVARVASSGIWAARLAGEGVTASPAALEHPKGLLRTISPHGRVDVDTPWGAVEGGLRILAVGLGIKQYPLCYSTHRVVDAAIDLASRDGFDVGAVDRVEVEIGRHQAAMARHHRPGTPMEARYSVEFAAVSGLVARAAGFEQLDAAFIAAPEVRRLVAATTITLRDDTSPDDPVFSTFDRVRVLLRDGRVLDSGEVRHSRGHMRLPASAAERRRKFIDCARRGGRDDAAALFERLIRLGDIADLRELAAT